MVQMEGCYEHEKSENFESYLTAMEVPMVPRKMMLSTNPTVEISKDGEEWTISFKVAIMSNTVKFQLGKEFTEKEPLSGDTNKVLHNDENIQSIHVC